MRKFAALLFLSSGFAGGFAPAQTLSPESKQFVRVDAPVVALEHVRVIDGTGAPAQEDQTVILKDGRIQSVSEASTASVPKDAQALDLHGYTVIPGLVGMHDHLFYPMGGAVYADMPFSFPRLYLAAGVTTIRTGGSIETYTDLELKRQIDGGRMPGPKMHVTGPYLEGKGAFAVELHQLSGPEDAVRTVNYWLDEGVDNFKVYNLVTREELAATIKAAHARSAKVTGHLCSIGFREAAALGIDDLEHGLLVDTEFFPEKKPDQCPDIPDDTARYARIDIQSSSVREMIADLIQHHVAVTSTLPVFEVEASGRPAIQQRVLDALSTEAKSQFLGNKARMSDTARAQRLYHTDMPPAGAALQKEMDFERAFVKAGGTLLAGEDPTGIGGVLAGFGDQREVELLVEAGFTALEAIHIATYNGARYLGDDGKVGTIAPGKQADLVLIKGNPSKTISDIENVEVVFKDGIGYDSAKLVESVRGLVGIR